MLTNPTKNSTRKTLAHLVERLNKRLERPATAYTRLNDQSGAPVRDTQGFTMQPNAGHFKLSAWSPGDGWTRYKLSTMLAGGGESDVHNTSFRVSEMYAYLRGVHDALDTEYTHQFDNAKTIEAHNALVSACTGALACLASGDLTPDMALTRLRTALDLNGIEYRKAVRS